MVFNLIFAICNSLPAPNPEPSSVDVEFKIVLSDRLRKKSEAIAERWLAVTLVAYPADSAAAFRRERDRFANPVGHALRVGTRAAVEALLEGRPSDEICSHLSDIVKMRAVQELRPSQAIGFVFSLKEAVREELGSENLIPKTSEVSKTSEVCPGPASLPELTDLDRRIDQVALAAFDVYMRYRAQVYELRINEVKRSVATIAQRAQRGGGR